MAGALVLVLTALLLDQVRRAWSYSRTGDGQASAELRPACRVGFHNGRRVRLQEDGRPLMYLD